LLISIWTVCWTAVIAESDDASINAM
jgi:hypothetical protein